MKTFLLFFLVALVSGASADDQEAPKSNVLKTLPTDNVESLGTTIVVDKQATADGHATLKVTTLNPTLICLGEFSIDEVEKAKLTVKAKLKSEKLKGTARVEIGIFWEGEPYFGSDKDSVVTQTLDWTEVGASYILRGNVKTNKVIVVLVISGRGTVWVDDVKVTKN